MDGGLGSLHIGIAGLAGLGWALHCIALLYAVVRAMRFFDLDLGHAIPIYLTIHHMTLLPTI